jgi:hypothetical protein
MFTIVNRNNTPKVSVLFGNAPSEAGVKEVSLGQEILKMSKEKGMTPEKFFSERKQLLEKAKDEDLKKFLASAEAGKAGKTKEYNQKLVSEIKEILTTRSSAKAKETVAAASDNAASKWLKESVATVQDTVHDASVKAVPPAAPSISEGGALKPVENVKDPKVQALLDSYNEQAVKKPLLLKALSRAVTNYGWYDAVYERVTGEKPTGTPEDVKKFQNSLNTNISFLQQFDGGNAGLDALLSGKTDLYLKQVAEKMKSNGGKMEIHMPAEGISPQAQTIAGAVATVVVAYGTGGLVMAGHEASTVNADKFVKEFNADKEGGFWHGLGKALVWLKEAAMWRKLSITLGANDKEGNVEKYYGTIRDFTKKVMDTPDLSKSEDAQIKSMYEAAKWFAEKAGVSPTDERFKKAIIQSYILNEGYAREGVDWKANIGLLFIGAGREQVKVSNSATIGDSAFNETEKTLTARSIDSRELISAGVKIEKNPEGKWVHTIPDTIQFTGDPENIPVIIEWKKAESGKYTIETSIVQSLRFSDAGNGYVVTLVPANSQPAPGETTATPKGEKMLQSADTVRNIREKTEKMPFADKLFAIWHMDPKAFGPLLRALGSQDAQGAKTALEVLKKTNYKTLATQLLKDFDTLQNVWNTYTYGTKNYRKVESANQSQYNAMRTPAVLSAESGLATKANITGSTPESEFKTEKYSPKQLSSIYAGQEMTVACFATPLADGKTWVHRVDTMDGSFSVHSKTVELSGDYKNQVIDSMTKLVNNDKKGIQGQVDKLNKFLKNNGISTEVKQDQYVAYLKSANIADLHVSGLELQADKWTKVFEARAMIAGNVCLNRTHGIVYPLFAINVPGQPPVTQSANAVATLDYTTPTNYSGVEARQSALGLSPIGAIANARANKWNDGSPTGPKTNPGGGPETPMDPKVPGAPLTPSPTPVVPPSPTPVVPPGSGA